MEVKIFSALVCAGSRQSLVAVNGPLLHVRRPGRGNSSATPVRGHHLQRHTLGRRMALQSALEGRGGGEHQRDKPGSQALERHQGDGGQDRRNQNGSFQLQQEQHGQDDLLQLAGSRHCNINPIREIAPLYFVLFRTT